jgi:hypothetical protein
MLVWNGLVGRRVLALSLFASTGVADKFGWLNGFDSHASTLNQPGGTNVQRKDYKRQRCHRKSR